MCGIVGMYLKNGPCAEATLVRMRDLVTHRGPDDAGSYLDGPVGMGHRRLSIIDLGGGHQPMSTTDGRFTIVFNGEIYNFSQLRRELEAKGAVFHTDSDTEVILQLHAAQGDAAVSRLNGIFAYALWDRDSRRLLLVRDRAGIKPLYYSATPEGFAFASEIKSLFESQMSSPSLNAGRVGEYLLFRQVAGQECLFNGVLSLPPGHVLEVGPNGASAPRQYWTLSDLPPAFDGGYGDAVDAVEAALSAAVERQLMSDVPLGTFCSGGLDSSLVTALAASRASGQINTFSVGFAESTYDESRYARAASVACGTKHHELRIDEARFAELLPRLVWHHDLPLNFANSVHIFAVSELAREHVTVVLTGEGADELFGGYPRYSLAKLSQVASYLPRPIRRAASGLLGGMSDHRLRRVATVLTDSVEEAVLFNSTPIGPEAVAELLGGEGVGDALATRRQLAREARARRRDPFSAVAELDFSTYLVSILNRQDKMSMATSLEARVPFLDNEVIDMARSLPQGFKQTLRRRKQVLKDVARRWLPAEIVDRRKSGFGVPLPEWFRGSGPMAAMLDEAVSSAEVGELVSVPALERLLHEHRSLGKDHSELFWGVLNLRLWRAGFRC